MTKDDRRAMIVLAGIAPASLALLGALLLLPVKGWVFYWSYHRLDEGMAFAEVDESLSAYRRDDGWNGLLGVEAPPAGRVWFCDLGVRGDFNTIRCRFVDGRLVEKSFSWD